MKRICFAFVAGGCFYSSIGYLGDWKTFVALTAASVFMLVGAFANTGDEP